MNERPRRFRVLIVDDNEVFLAAARGWIGTQPSLDVVGTASDGEEALAFLDALQPDLVLIDALMPGIGGFEAVRRIKLAPGAPSVVMLSLHEGAAVEHEAWMAGADGFVTKSQLHAQLPSLLQELLASSPPARRSARLDSPFTSKENGGI